MELLSLFISSARLPFIFLLSQKEYPSRQHTAQRKQYSHKILLICATPSVFIFQTLYICYRDRKWTDVQRVHQLSMPIYTPVHPFSPIKRSPNLFPVHNPNLYFPLKYSIYSQVFKVFPLENLTLNINHSSLPD